ncbi:MAG: N-acetylneuraminate synthase family protein [Candidatus Heimdallarchaeota archaeon]|nr:N-acetylneuraminate synthase family protein [Candidatus Heimdallarchaeota archaeon]MCK4877279.1 N-acetylneuraminate synthase family protein [Candidatus Heimdallarchaeota archaeon]
MKEIEIGKIAIREGEKPFIIAEAGVNYENDIDTALRMVKEAANAGADAIKFQTYKAETLAAKDSPAYWETNKTQRDFFKLYDSFGDDEYIELAKEAERRDIIFMSTPFDNQAVDFLDNLMPVYKIASADITNFPFLRYIAKKKKPIFLSTGASTIDEIKEAVKAIIDEKNSQIVLMHCILSYPTKYEDANLAMTRHLKECFPNYLLGYSDHTVPDENMLVLLTSYLLGARVIEKHFTLDKTLPGNDHYHAMDPSDLIEFRKNIDFIMSILGEEEKKPINAEKSSRKFARRSIVADQDILKGEIITIDMISFKRPGTGINPKFCEKVIGMKAKRNIKNDEILSWKDLD